MKHTSPKGSFTQRYTSFLSQQFTTEKVTLKEKLEKDQLLSFWKKQYSRPYISKLKLNRFNSNQNYYLNYLLKSLSIKYNLSFRYPDGQGLRSYLNYYLNLERKRDKSFLLLLRLVNKFLYDDPTSVNLKYKSVLDETAFDAYNTYFLDAYKTMLFDPKKENKRLKQLLFLKNFPALHLYKKNLFFQKMPNLNKEKLNILSQLKQPSSLFLDPRLLRVYDLDNLTYEKNNLKFKKKEYSFFASKKPLRQSLLNVPKSSLSSFFAAIPFSKIAIEKNKPSLLHNEEWYKRWYWQLSLRRLNLKKKIFKEFCFF